MTDAGYVFAAWGITAVVLGWYSVRLLRAVRQAEANAADQERADTGREA